MKQQVSALIIALILAFTLASCSTSSEPSASSQEKQNSTTEPVELSEEAAKMVASIFGAQVETDLTKGTLMPYSGYYYGVVEMPQEPPVNGRMATRIYKQYIPEGLHRSMDYEVLLTVPDGWNTEQFLISSGWKDLADEKIFSLFILEPGESGWGSEDEESYYIEQSFIHR